MAFHAIILLLPDTNVENATGEFPNHFASLAIPWGASTEEIGYALDRGALLCHPDNVSQELSADLHERAIDQYAVMMEAA